jgi:hypothetical protein
MQHGNKSQPIAYQHTSLRAVAGASVIADTPTPTICRTATLVKQYEEWQPVTTYWLSVLRNRRATTKVGLRRGCDTL